MVIGIYSPYLNTLTGGEKYIFTAASCLSSEHKVVIFWDDPEILKKASEKFDLDLSRVDMVENIFKKKTSILKRYITTLKYDRILFLSDGSIPIVGAKKLLIHFQFPVEWINTNSFVFLFKKSRIAKIICNSYFTKEFIDKKFKMDSFILYPPIKSGIERINKKDKLILTVGRYSLLPNGSDFKKLSFLVESFKKFQKKRLKGWKLAIVTSVQPELEGKFSEFEKGIKSSNIEVYKNTSFFKIRELYEKAMVYWHASGYSEDLVKHPERAEHFGISTVEAMSNGAVPVVINAGGQPEIVKDSDNGFLWNTQEDLIRKTHKIAVDKELFKNISQRAIESSQVFSEERFCEELNHLIW